MVKHMKLSRAEITAMSVFSHLTRKSDMRAAIRFFRNHPNINQTVIKWMELKLNAQ